MWKEERLKKENEKIFFIFFNYEATSLTRVDARRPKEQIDMRKSVERVISNCYFPS